MRHRRLFVTCPVVALLVLSVLFGPASTVPANAQDEDATALLQESAHAIADLKSFGFSLKTVQGRSTIFSALELKSVTGAVERPDSFRAEATVSVAVAQISVKAIGINGRLWVTDPLKPGDVYTEVTAGGEESSQVIDTLLNPDALLLRAVDFIQDPKIDGHEKIGTVETTRITGTFDPNDVLAAGGISTPEAGSASDFLVLQPMPIWLWLDGDHHLVRMELAGPITKSESSDVVRRLDLFDFDQPANITAPAT